MHVEVNRSLNELDLLAMVYETENEQIKKFIDTEMLSMQRRIRESTKASSGLFSRFIGGRQSDKSAVSVNDVWMKLAENESVKNYKHLVQEMGMLKKKEEGKQ